MANPKRVAWTAALLAAAFLAAYVASGPAGRGLSVLALSVLVTLTTCIKLARAAPRERLVLSLIATGFAILTATNGLWVATVGFGGAAVPPQPLSSIGMAAAYLLLLAGAVLAIAPTIRRDWGGIVDAAAIGVGVGMTLWIVAVAPALEGHSDYSSRRVYVLTLMISLSAIVGVVAGAWSSKVVSTEARPTLAYLGSAVVLALAGNVLNAIVADPVTHESDPLPGLLWPLSYAAAWAGIAHPASAQAFRVTTRERTRLTPLRMALIGAALGNLSLVAVVLHTAGRTVDWFSLAVGQLILVAMVLARFAQLAHVHRRTEQRLKTLAEADPLTGLANRRAVSHHLGQLAQRVGEGAADGAVACFMDLDGFKEVNDEHGHAVGDELLTAIANRLASSVRVDGRDLVGRLGGDEFIVVFEGDPSVISDAIRARVQGLFSQPFELSVGPVSISASVGLASASPGDSASVDALLTEADHEMYSHKRSRDATGPR